MGDAGQDVRDLAGVAERLRAVKNARRRFLRLWGIEQALVEPMLDRVAADVEQAQEEDDDDDATAGELPPPLYDGYEPPAGGPPSAFGR